jgi:hypothetical protein
MDYWLIVCGVLLLSAALVSAQGLDLASVGSVFSRGVAWFFLQLNNWELFTQSNHIKQVYIVLLLVADVFIAFGFLYSAQKGMSTGISFCFGAFILTTILILGYIGYCIVHTRLLSGLGLLPF